jgi:hypothetical protein
MAPAQSSFRQPGPADWRDGLPKDMHRVAEKFESPADVVKSYAVLERRLGRSVTIPAEDATREENAAFYARLGRPETPEGYEVRLPADLPDHLRPPSDALEGRADFLAAMHAAGATPAIVQAAFDWYYGTLGKADAEMRRAQEAARSGAEKSLRTEWGAAYERNIELARRAARRFGGDDLVDRFERFGLADDPVCLKAFRAIGAAMAEDGLLAGDGVPAGDAQQRIDRIMKDHFGRPSYASTEVQDELRDLYRDVCGAEPSQS